MRVSEGRANLFALPSGSILEQAKLGQLRIRVRLSGRTFFCGVGGLGGNREFKEFREFREFKGL
jgi:hypothetical protein